MERIPDPPLHMIEYVSGVRDVEQSRKIGEMHRNFFVNECGLKPNDAVLEAGCGVGRVAAALTQYLSPQGRFEGFDISKEAIDWCTDEITSRYKNFHFQHVDLFNEFYNPGSKTRARRYRFPFADKTFDFVYLTSVFTHLLPRDLENYIAETSRVMKRGGRGVMTFFLHDEESAKNIRLGKSTFQLPGRCGLPIEKIGQAPKYNDWFTETFHEPERVVAYETQGILDQLKTCGFKVDRVVPGSWSGRPSTGFQDIVVTTKTANVSLRFTIQKTLRFEGLREWVWLARKRMALARVR